MPVQQIVVNPVTSQQTNNKDRKVSFLSLARPLYLNSPFSLFFVYFHGKNLDWSHLCTPAFVYMEYMVPLTV